MAVIKSFTDLEQSKKLAEILPLESADMCWTNHYYGTIRSSMTISAKTIKEYKELLESFHDSTDIDVFYPCWSLAALLGTLPNVDLCTPTLKMKLNHKYYMELCIDCANHKCISTNDYDNPVDACVAMVEKLHKLNLL